MNKILSLIKSHALNGKLFDVRNPAMIICDQVLENIFQVRALHVTQVRAALAKSLVRLTVMSEEPCVTLYATQNRNKVCSRTIFFLKDVGHSVPFTLQLIHNNVNVSRYSLNLEIFISI